MNGMNFYLVHQLQPRDGNVGRRLVGKLLIDGDHVHHLCDYQNVLRCVPEGKLDTHSQRALERLMGASYYDLQKKDPLYKPPEPLAPEPAVEPEPIPGDVQSTVSPPKKPPAVFDYMRAGMDRPHTVEIHAGKALLDGKELSPEETHLIKENVRNGLATIRHRKPEIHYPQSMDTTSNPKQALIQKFEGLYFDLQKAEGLAGSLDSLRSLVASGHLSQEQYDIVRRELYQDEMIPSIGNKRAFKEHMLSSPQGVYLSIDVNGLKSVNDTHGHDAGDKMISGIGECLRRATDKTVGSEHGKVWRKGGDEFSCVVPSTQHATHLLRQLRNELAAIPPIGGTHHLSVSAGIGPSFAEADKSMYDAKQQKMSAIAARGGDPTNRTEHAPHHLYVSSAMPGSEGPVPVEQDQLPLNPPGEAKKLISEAAKVHDGVEAGT